MKGIHSSCQSHYWIELSLLTLLLSIALAVPLELGNDGGREIPEEQTRKHENTLNPEADISGKPTKASATSSQPEEDMEARGSGESGEEGGPHLEEAEAQESTIRHHMHKKRADLEVKGEAEDGDQAENHSGGDDDDSGHDSQDEKANQSSEGHSAESEWRPGEKSDDSSSQAGVGSAEGSPSGDGRQTGVERKHGENPLRNREDGQLGDEASGENSGHSGDHKEHLSNPAKPYIEEDHRDTVQHKPNGISGDHNGINRHDHENQEKSKKKDPDQHQVDIHHQGTAEQVSTAGPTTQGATEVPTEEYGKLGAVDSDFYFEEVDDEAKSYQVDIIQADQHKVSCSHHDRTITDGTVVYVRAECRLCQCVNGTLQCERKAPNCTNYEALPCVLERGGELKDGDIHYDGCNRCFCQTGELQCTRMRCKSSGYNYTNYARIPDHKLDRGIDSCLECDHEPISAVCGPNGKTYRSMCHAFFCAGLTLQDLQMGVCEDLNPCQFQFCKGKNEICMATPKICLAVETRAGKKVDCPQHKCVAIRETCPLQSEADQAVCGVDGQTYPTECHLIANSVLLAYWGSCRKSCVDGDYQVCGVDAVTFESPCQANLLNQHMDYQGACEAFAAKPDVIMQQQGPDLYVNRRCSRLKKKERCPQLTCQQAVTPQGACCPICGAALSIHLDTAIQDMIELHVVQPAQDLNSLDAVYSTIANMQDADTLHKCLITVDLADTNDVVSTFVPKNPYDLKTCVEAARATVKKIAFKPDRFDPYQALLASAVMTEPDELDGSDVKDLAPKRRVRRGEHHDHENIYTPTGNSTSAGEALQMTPSWLVPVLLPSLVTLC